jgi:hypothetical protein
LPRKYRPPAARRRKAKKQAPYYVEPLPETSPADAGSDGASQQAIDELEAADAIERAPAVVESRQPERATGTQVRHIARDYSYVRAEVKRIALVGGFLILSLIITAILRG